MSVTDAAFVAVIYPFALLERLVDAAVGRGPWAVALLLAALLLAAGLLEGTAPALPY